MLETTAIEFVESCVQTCACVFVKRARFFPLVYPAVHDFYKLNDAACSAQESDPTVTLKLETMRYACVNEVVSRAMNKDGCLNFEDRIAEF